MLQARTRTSGFSNSFYHAETSKSIAELTKLHGETPEALLVMMLMMRVIVTIRTGRCAPLSTSRFTRMPATGLAQNYPPPEIAREFA